MEKKLNIMYMKETGEIEHEKYKSIYKFIGNLYKIYKNKSIDERYELVDGLCKEILEEVKNIYKTDERYERYEMYKLANEEYKDIYNEVNEEIKYK